LISRQQASGENVLEHLRALKLLAKDCSFEDVRASRYRDELIRDSFINGLSNPSIRQRLLEGHDIDLQRAAELADSLERAQLQALSMGKQAVEPTFAAATPGSTITHEELSPFVASPESVAALPKAKKDGRREKCCFYCGGPLHNRNFCPAREQKCHNCGKRGHLAKVCRGKPLVKPTSASACLEPLSSSLPHSLLAAANAEITSCAGAPSCLRSSVVDAKIDGHTVKALFDSGASENFIDKKLADCLHLEVKEQASDVTMASTKLLLKTKGRVGTDVTVLNRNYPLVTLDVMQDSCADLILGQKFLKRHKTVTFEFGEPEEALVVTSKADTVVAALPAANVDPPSLFEFMKPDRKPFACRTRRRTYSKDYLDFIESEVERMLSEGIIEPATSPWRAQVLVVRNKQKPRLVIDYSQTVNRFTLLDAHPLPRIEDIVNKVSKDKYYSSLDLRSAYQ